MTPKDHLAQVSANLPVEVFEKLIEPMYAHNIEEFKNFMTHLMMLDELGYQIKGKTGDTLEILNMRERIAELEMGQIPVTGVN